MRQCVILLFLMLLGALEPALTQTHPVVLVAGSDPTLTTMSAAVVGRDTIVALGEVLENYGQPALVRVGGRSVRIPLHPVCAPVHERAPGQALGRRVGPEIMVVTGALPTGTTLYRVSFSLASVGDSVTLVGYNRFLVLKSIGSKVEGIRLEVPFTIPLRDNPLPLLLLSHGLKTDPVTGGLIADAERELTRGAAVLDSKGRLLGLLLEKNPHWYGGSSHLTGMPLATSLDWCRPILDRLLSR